MWSQGEERVADCVTIIELALPNAIKIVGIGREKLSVGNEDRSGSHGNSFTGSGYSLNS